jgi:hypothetical protein
MACSDEDHGRSRRPGAEDRGWSHRSGTQWLGGREVGWRCVRSVPGTWRLQVWVSWLSLKTKGTWRHRSCPRLGSGSWSHRSRGGTGAALGWEAEAGATGHVAAPELLWAGQRELEPQDTFLPVCPQNRWSGFLVEPQKTKVVEGFPVWASKPAALVW